MQATKSLRYLRLIFILFIDISIYLKVFQKYIVFDETQYMRRHRKENKHQILEIKLFYFIKYHINLKSYISQKEIQSKI